MIIHAVLTHHLSEGGGGLLATISTGILNISSTEPIRLVQIFNANGQLMKEIQVMHSRNHLFQISDLPIGMYYARIFVDQRHIVKPFIRMQ